MSHSADTSDYDITASGYHIVGVLLLSPSGRRQTHNCGSSAVVQRQARVVAVVAVVAGTGRAQAPGRPGWNRVPPLVGRRCSGTRRPLAVNDEAFVLVGYSKMAPG